MSQGKTEPFLYAQDVMGLGSLSLGTEGNSQFSKGELKVLPSAQGSFKPALSTPGPVEKLPSASRTPRLFSSVLQDAGSFSLSSQNNLELSTSSQKHLESSPTPKTSLKHSPSFQESLGPTPSEPGTREHSLQYQGVQKVSAPAKVTLGQTPHQKGYEGNSLSSQGTVRLSISGQESLGYCSFDQGSPELSTSSNKKEDPTYNQGFVAQFPSVSLDTHSLSTQGMLQNLSSSKVTLETSSSLQKDIESSLDVHGVQELLSHSPGHLGHSQCTPKSSETLSSIQMVTESLSVILGTLPPLPGTLGHSISAQSALFPSESDQQIQESSSSSVQKPVQFSPSSKGSLRHTPSVLGTPQSLLSAKLCPKLSLSAQEFLGSSSPQQGCSGNSLSMQRTHGTSISAQEFVEPSKSDQVSPEIFTSSQEDLGPSLAQEALVHSSPTPQDCGLSQSSKDTLGTSISTQGAGKTPSSVQKSIVTVPSAQSVSGIQRPLGTSQFASETSEPSSEEYYSILKSISSCIETLTTILEKLRFSTSAKGTEGPSITDQVILRSPTVSHKVLEFSSSDQKSVKSASSQMGPPGRTSLTDKGLQEMSSGERVTLRDSPLQQISLENALPTQAALGLSISKQESLEHSPSVHGSPDTSLTLEKTSGICLDQGPLGLSLSLSDLGDLGLSEYSQGPLETSPSPHSILQIPSSTHGIIETSLPAQDPLGHLPPSVQILQQAPFMPETSEPLSSTEEACNISDSSPGTSETLPSTPGFLEILFSEQSTMGPSVSEKEILGPSVVSLEEFLGPSPPDQGSLRPTPSASGTGSLSPSERCCQEISSGVQGDSPSQQGYAGNSLHSQEALGLSTSAQESLGHSPSAQQSLDTSFLSQESLGPSLNHGPLGYSSSDAGDFGLSDSNQGTLETLSFTQSILEIPSSNNGVTETSTTFEDSLEHLPSSVQPLQPSLTPETSDPLPTAKEVCKISESVSGSLEPPALSELNFRSGSPNKEERRCSPFTQGDSRHSKLKKTKSTHGSKESHLKSVPSEDKGLKSHRSSKKGVRASVSNKVGSRLKTEPKDSLTTTFAQEDCRSSRSHEEHLRYSPSSQGRSRSTKTKLEEASSNKANFCASHTEHEGWKHLSLSQRGSRHALSAKRDKKPIIAPQESVEASTSTEGNIGTTPSHEETLRNSASPHGTSRLTSSTSSTRKRLRHSPYTQKVIKVTTESQESFTSTLDGDSPSGSVKSFSSPQSNDVRHPVSTKEDFKHSLYVQEGQKPSTGAREGNRAWIPVQWGLIYSPTQKQSVTSFPVVQGNFRHTRPQLADLRSSLSYQGKDTAFQYEHGTPICDPSVLGGHRYSRSVPYSLRRIPLPKKSLSSNLIPQGDIRPSQCEQRGLRHSYGYPVQGSFKMFQSERGNLMNTPSKTLSLRFAPYDKRELKNMPSNVEWVRTSTSAPGSPQHNPSAHGGFNPYKPFKLKF